MAYGYPYPAAPYGLSGGFVGGYPVGYGYAGAFGGSGFWFAVVIVLFVLLLIFWGWWWFASFY